LAWVLRYVFAVLLLLIAPLQAAPNPVVTLSPPPPQLDVPYVVTPPEVVQVMLTMADVHDNDIVYDLGSGDGRIVIAAARDRGAHGIGVELDGDLVRQSRANAHRAGVADKVKFLQQDLFKTDLHEATVVTMYLLPKINLELRPKLLAELNPGCRIVSHTYDMGDWQPDRREVVPSHAGPRPVLFWIVPASVEGNWSLPGHGTLHLHQKFQQVDGTLDGTALQQVELRGKSLAFTCGNQRFTGIVGQDRMQGTVAGQTWTATKAPP
jgi:SAM-dependent methyltransferase